MSPLPRSNMESLSLVGEVVFHLMERISTVYDIDRSRYKTMKELIPWLFDKAGLLSLSCMIHKNKNKNLIVCSAMTGPFS